MHCFTKEGPLQELQIPVWAPLTVPLWEQYTQVTRSFTKLLWKSQRYVNNATRFGSPRGVLAKSPQSLGMILVDNWDVGTVPQSDRWGPCWAPRILELLSARGYKEALFLSLTLLHFIACSSWWQSVISTLRQWGQEDHSQYRKFKTKLGSWRPCLRRGEGEDKEEGRGEQL